MATKEYNALYYERHAEELKAYQVRYRAEHPELITEQKRKYRKDNPEVGPAAVRRHYTRKQTRIKEFKEQSGGCPCGIADVRVLHLHHRDPDLKNPKLRQNGGHFHRLTWEELEAELLKCDVLCANCHILVTWHE